MINADGSVHIKMGSRNYSENTLAPPSATEISQNHKIGGILIFALVALWASGFNFQATDSVSAADDGLGTGFLAAVALAILAYKGFTTITNSGGEIRDPKKNVGRSITLK